jgi:hypothetical protein
MINNRFKFRAWDEKNKKIIYSEHTTTDFVFGGMGDGVYEKGKLTLDLYNNLMQCTGLEDKNGKLIYEGDIMRGVNALFKIEWGEKLDTLGWIMTVIKPTRGLSLNERHSLFNGWGVIVGNIYENPELLNNE